MIYDIFTDYLNRIEYIDEIIYNLKIILNLIYFLDYQEYLANDVYLNINLIIDGIINIILEMKKNNLVIYEGIKNTTGLIIDYNIIYFTINYYDDYKVGNKFIEMKISLSFFNNFKTLKILTIRENINNLICKFNKYREICQKYLLYSKNYDLLI